MDEHICELQELIEIQYDKLMLPAYCYNDSVQGSHSSDAFEEKMIKYLDKQTELAELFFEYEVFRERVLMQLLKLETGDDTHMCYILYKVYFKFMTLPEVAKALSISKQCVFKLHPAALVLFYDQYLSGANTKAKIAS